MAKLFEVRKEVNVPQYVKDIIPWLQTQMDETPERYRDVLELEIEWDEMVTNLIHYREQTEEDVIRHNNVIQSDITRLNRQLENLRARLLP